MSYRRPRRRKERRRPPAQPQPIGTCTTCGQPGEKLDRLHSKTCNACIRVLTLETQLAHLEELTRKSAVDLEARSNRIRALTERTAREVQATSSLAAEFLPHGISSPLDALRNVSARLDSLRLEVRELAQPRPLLARLFSPGPSPDKIRSEISKIEREIELLETQRAGLDRLLEATRTAERLAVDREALLRSPTPGVDLPGLIQRAHEELTAARRKIEQRKARHLAQCAKEEAMRAAAAAHQGRIREDADRVKTQLSREHPCPYCEGDLGAVPHADHIYPVSSGGLSVGHNMVYICSACNLSKAAATLFEFVERRGFVLAEIVGRLRALGKRV